MPKQAIPGSIAARLKTAMNERSVTPGKFARLFELAPSVLNNWLKGDIPPIYEPMVNKWLYEGVGPTKADLEALRTGNKRQQKPKEPPKTTQESIAHTIKTLKNLIGSEVTVRQMEEYGLTHCELKDIAALHKIPLDNFKEMLKNKPDLQMAYDAGEAAGRMALRKRQFEIAQSNSNSSGVMAIFLGKNDLNQTDKPQIDAADTKPDRIVYKWADEGAVDLDAEDLKKIKKKTPDLDLEDLINSVPKKQVVVN